jgi:hypothetical protein
MRWRRVPWYPCADPTRNVPSPHCGAPAPGHPTPLSACLPILCVRLYCMLNLVCAMCCVTLSPPLPCFDPAAAREYSSPRGAFLRNSRCDGAWWACGALPVVHSCACRMAVMACSVTAPVEAPSAVWWTQLTLCLDCVSWCFRCFARASWAVAPRRVPYAHGHHDLPCKACGGPEG